MASPPVAVSSVTPNPTTATIPATATPAEGEEPSTSGTQQFPAAAQAPDALPAGWVAFCPTTTPARPPRKKPTGAPSPGQKQRGYLLPSGQQSLGRLPCIRARKVWKDCSFYINLEKNLNHLGLNQCYLIQWLEMSSSTQRVWLLWNKELIFPSRVTGFAQWKQLFSLAFYLNGPWRTLGPEYYCMFFHDWSWC